MKSDELVNEIYQIVQALAEQSMSDLSPDTLSRLAVKLASYKASLGEYVTEAKKAVWAADADYQSARAESYKELRAEGKGTTDADELKRLGADSALRALNEAKYNSERIVQLSMDCHDLIDAVKSRLIYFQTERNESNVY